MVKRQDVLIDLKPVGINRVAIGGHDITDVVRHIEINAEAGELTIVTLGLIPEATVVKLDEADIVIGRAK